MYLVEKFAAQNLDNAEQLVREILLLTQILTAGWDLQQSGQLGHCDSQFGGSISSLPSSAAADKAAAGQIRTFSHFDAF